MHTAIHTHTFGVLFLFVKGSIEWNETVANSLKKTAHLCVGCIFLLPSRCGSSMKQVSCSEKKTRHPLLLNPPKKPQTYTLWEQLVVRERAKRNRWIYVKHKYIWSTLEMEPETLGKTFNHQKMLNKRWTWSLGMWVSLSTHLKDVYTKMYTEGESIQLYSDSVGLYLFFPLSLEQRRNGAASSLKRDFSSDSLTKMTRYP